MYVCSCFVSDLCTNVYFLDYKRLVYLILVNETSFLYVVFLLITLVISNCIHDYDTSISMFFVNNYIVVVLSVTDMAFKGLRDVDPSDPSALVLPDKHKSHLVDTKQVCILLHINHYYILLM